MVPCLSITAVAPSLVIVGPLLAPGVISRAGTSPRAPTRGGNPAGDRHIGLSLRFECHSRAHGNPAYPYRLPTGGCGGLLGLAGPTRHNVSLL